MIWPGFFLFFLVPLRILFGFSLAVPRGYPHIFMIIMVVHLL
jgi:hypothetical protein